MLLTVLVAVSQPIAGTHIVGYVRDSLSRDAIPYASVAFLGDDGGVTGTEQGGFTIDTDIDVLAIRISAVGYHSKDVVLNPNQTVVVVDLVRSAVELEEVLVQRNKEKYSKKNNPAVELLRRIRANMHDHDPMNSAYYSYDRYERLMYGFNDLDEVASKGKIFRRLGTLGEYTDTSTVTGKRVLPIAIKEQVSQEYYRRSPKTHKQVVTGVKNSGIDESMDQASMKRYLDDVFREVDIFANDVTLLSNRFVSPLSAIAADFYKFYLTDTLDIDGEQCVELSFTPHTPETFGFLGRMYLPLNDSTMFVKKVMMGVPSRINLNYVERVSIEQDFERMPDGTRLKLRDDMEVEFRLMKGTPGFFARRETAYTGHSLAAPDDLNVFNQRGEQKVQRDAEYMPDEFWTDRRPKVMRTDAGTVKKMLSRLRESHWFYLGEKVIVALIKGYVPTGDPSKWDFGPINTTISGNALEGVRLRLGGMTTVNLNRHWFARTYVAYGFRDKRLKYMGQLEYSFNEKKQLDQEFPIHSIRLMHKYDIDKLGQTYLYTNPDNVFLQLKRQKDDQIAYLRTTELEWKYETLSHFSVALGLEHKVHEASRLLPFVNVDGSLCDRYTQAGFHATLRYAPGEKFYQTRSHRLPINMDAPIVTLSHTWHPKGWMGTAYEMHKTELGLQKRFWFSAFGYTDIIVKGAKIWNQVPYPDLLIPNANLSYTIQPESFALMDAMEFVNDQYLSWDVTYWANGALLNRIPLIKYLKLREVFTFRGLWGSLSDRNNPAVGADVLQFPTNAMCAAMDKKPYMEIGVGLDNILTFLRLDYVWRLTYRDTPGVNRGGVRIQLHFNF
ncbi:MAG: carboxypeptidase-like regulatory domain-containing protein [Muribaculaceae bacterium]|nr:carboxypeptidase-like regulatory domain-containing protein [Muribaculaceae bacterium]